MSPHHPAMKWASGAHLPPIRVDAPSIMGKVTLTTSNGATLPPGAGPQAALAPAAAVWDPKAVFPAIGSIESVRQEVDDAFADATDFHTHEPDEVMRMCSGHSARLSELRVRIMRIEDFQRQWKQVRTRDIEPCLEELREQYAIASRLHSVRELDWKMSQGQP